MISNICLYILFMPWLRNITLEFIWDLVSSDSCTVLCLLCICFLFFFFRCYLSSTLLFSLIQIISIFKIFLSPSLFGIPFWLAWNFLCLVFFISPSTYLSNIELHWKLRAFSHREKVLSENRWDSRIFVYCDQVDSSTSDV